MKNISIKYIALIFIFFFAEMCFAQEWELIWSDEFDQSSLDLKTWNIEVNDLGGYNNELQYYTARPENIRIEDGNLVIEALKENYKTREYTSARINSHGKKSFKYGRIEARLKLPYGNGMWPAFWMMGESGGWPANGEIDIMEMVGGDKCGYECGDNKTHGYMHWDDNGLNSTGTMAPLLDSGKYADDYHIFGIEWDADQIKWFVDSTEFYSHSITASGQSEFHQPFYFLLNLAVGGDWPGSPDSSTVFPQRLYVDYVRVYRKEETSGLNEKEKTPADKFVLQQNYPNPFNPLTNVDFGLEKKSTVSLNVFNSLGQKIKSIINDQVFSSGSHEIQIDMSDHSSGIYFLVLKEQNNVQVKKMTLLK